MTETEWQASAAPWAMLEFLERRGSERKLLLHAAACCRRVLPLSDDPRYLAAVEAAERRSAGELDAAGFEEALRPIVEVWARLDETEEEWPPARYLTAAVQHVKRRGSAKYAANFAARGLAASAGGEDDPAGIAARRTEEGAQADLLRDMIGDPSRPFAFDPAWRLGEGRPAAELAREIDREGRFEHLAPLAEVLERSGCRDRAVLDHCREAGPHARGCWVVDALLGREPAVRPGLLTEADWFACADPTSLLRFLRDRGTERRWRLFAVACCRRIGPLIADDRSRRAVDVAAWYADGSATAAHLEAARAEAQAAQEKAKRVEYATEAQENCCITPRYAAVSRDLYAAWAARGAVNRDPRATDDELCTYKAEWWKPSHTWAVAAVRWAVFAQPPDVMDAKFDAIPDEQFDFPFVMTEHGKLASGPPDPALERAAEVAAATESRAQCAILHDLFGDLLGPPGDDGAWLPCGQAAPVAEWWCRLPTPLGIVVRPEWLDWAEGKVAMLVREIAETEAFDRLPELAAALEGAGCAELAILDHLRSAGPHFPGCWVVDLLLGRS